MTALSGWLLPSADDDHITTSFVPVKYCKRAQGSASTLASPIIQAGCMQGLHTAKHLPWRRNLSSQALEESARPSSLLTQAGCMQGLDTRKHLEIA